MDFFDLCFDGGETGRVEVQCNGMLLMFVNHCVSRKPTLSLQSEPMLPEIYFQNKWRQENEKKSMILSSVEKMLDDRATRYLEILKDA